MTARLTLGGSRHEGWTEVTVRRSVETISGAFSVLVSEREPGAATPRSVTPGEACTLALDGETVVTGYVDGVEVSYDDASHMIRVKGRDRAGDLVDCSAEQNEWLDETLDVIAAAIAAPFGIGVAMAAGVAPGEPFRKFTIERGETAWDAIDRLTRLRAVLAVSDGKGGIVLGRAARDRARTRLERGRNVLRLRGRADWRERHSEYTVIGQQAGSDELFGDGDAKPITQVSAIARDNGVTRHRPLVVLAEQGVSQAEATERVEWEAAVRRGRSREIVATVQGWRERGGEGALWAPGRVVRLTDDWAGIDRDLLIATVQQHLSDDGTLSELTLMPEDAFLPGPADTPSGSSDERSRGYWE